MSNWIEIRQFKLRCGNWPACESEARGESTNKWGPDIPVGWKHRKTHGCGMTGYTRHDVICPKCAEGA